MVSEGNKVIIFTAQILAIPIIGGAVATFAQDSSQQIIATLSMSFVQFLIVAPVFLSSGIIEDQKFGVSDYVIFGVALVSVFFTHWMFEIVFSGS